VGAKVTGAFIDTNSEYGILTAAPQQPLRSESLRQTGSMSEESLPDHPDRPDDSSALVWGSLLPFIGTT
jgi:hypothetical protein